MHYLHESDVKVALTIISMVLPEIAVKSIHQMRLCELIYSDATLEPDKFLHHYQNAIAALIALRTLNVCLEQNLTHRTSCVVLPQRHQADIRHL